MYALRSRMKLSPMFWSSLIVFHSEFILCEKLVLLSCRVTKKLTFYYMRGICVARSTISKLININYYMQALYQLVFSLCILYSLYLHWSCCHYCLRWLNFFPTTVIRCAGWTWSPGFHDGNRCLSTGWARQGWLYGRTTRRDRWYSSGNFIFICGLTVVQLLSKTGTL